MFNLFDHHELWMRRGEREDVGEKWRRRGFGMMMGFRGSAGCWTPFDLMKSSVYSFAWEDTLNPLLTPLCNTNGGGAP